MKRVYASLAVAFVVALTVAAAALAGGSTLLSGYGGEAGAGTTLKPKAPTAAPVSSGTLPFTGTDLAFGGAAGLVLAASGFGLRRLGRNKS